MTTELCSTYGIRDLLPHENILNFHVGVPTLPSWATDLTFKGMLGVGDLDQRGVLNVERFSEFDVYICYPWDNQGSLRANLEVFLTLTNKLMCFIDFTDESHIRAFKTVFAERFTVLEGHGPHTPHLTPADLSFVLTEGGKASNIYERGSNVISVPILKEWLKAPYLNYVGRGHIFDTDTGGRYTHLSPEGKQELSHLFREAIRKAHSMSYYVKIEDDYYAMIDTWDLEECQTVLIGLLYESETPVNMRGVIQPFKPAWKSEEITELIYTKVSPNFFLGAIDKYVSTIGRDSKVERLEMIREKVMEDISKKNIYPGKAKYNTYRRELDKLSLSQRNSYL